ncbi:phage tail assembly chaperone [Sporomusa aerivorans]|uniref:phage tail assembly chaperone n=1 Tax=Sporomusa aerivorans TaxID=204936 RepID=UPI003529E938
MSKRETEKIITISNRKFKIEKMDALTGSYIAFTLAEKFLPMGLEAKAGLANMPKDRTMLSRTEFAQLQKDCLGVVSEVLPARAAPVIAENGSWGVENIAKDTRLVLLLTVHALAFNIAGFFDGEGLQELKAGLADIFPVSMPTSTDTPTPP